MARRTLRGTFLSLLLLTAAGHAEETRDAANRSDAEYSSTTAWRVRSTSNFRIHFHPMNAAIAREAAAAAEIARARIFRQWFSEDTPADWLVKCDVHIHRSREACSAATGRPEPTPGYSSVTLRRGRVVARRIDLLAQGTDLIQAVLPHEVCHVLLAAEFEESAPPLWVDEGIAVLSEKAAAKQAHEKTLDRLFQRGTRFSAAQLMTMKEYPSEAQRDLFYAESVSLVEYLMQHGGARHFMAFVRASAQKGYESELRRMYGISSFDQLDDWWSRQVRAAIASRASDRTTSSPDDPAPGSAAVPPVIAARSFDTK